MELDHAGCGPSAMQGTLVSLVVGNTHGLLGLALAFGGGATAAIWSTS